MSFPEDFDQQVALFLRLHLRGTREMLQRDARERLPALRRAWPSLRQANWLAEVAARATSVEDILNHLKQQGVRWADGQASPRLHKTIAEKIDHRLKRDVERSINSAAEHVAETLNLRDLPKYVPDEAWVRREYLALARLYIGTLVTWRRTDIAREGKS